MITIIALIICGICAVASVVALLLLRNKTNDGRMQAEMMELRQSLNDQLMKFSDQMSGSQQFNSRLLQSTQKDYRKAMSDVHSQLGQLQSATQQMVGIGKDISSLQDILKSPKLRGGMGELFLNELLGQILPQEHYETQYYFNSGVAVDAVIKLGDGLIPVDAKFPLENFQRLQAAEDDSERAQARKAFRTDVKKHVDSIAAKYILPEEETFDFAIMYIAAENVYYETIIKGEDGKDSIASHAISKKIIPVSPNSFYAYLQAIVRGLKGLRIEKSAGEILRSIGQLEADLTKLITDFEKTGTHLSNASTAYERTAKAMDKMKTKLSVLEETHSEKYLEKI